MVWSKLDIIVYLDTLGYYSHLSAIAIGFNNSLLEITESL